MTPCVVDLPYGHYRLYMSSPTEASEGGDVDDIEVGRGVNYYLRAPGKYESAKSFPPLPTAIGAVGMGMLIAGGIMMPATDDRAGSNHDQSVSPVGAGLVIGGLVAMGIGAILFYEQGRATRQDGATTFWRAGTATPPSAMEVGR